MSPKVHAPAADASAIAAAALATAKASSNAPGVVKRTNFFFIDPAMVIRREGWNPRFDFGEIDALKISLKANGMLNPIRVKRLPAAQEPTGHVFELIDGDRRLTAVQALIKEGHEFPEGIPAIIVGKDQDDVTGLIQMFEANSGKTFLPLEEAAAYQRMRDAGMTIKQICEKVGRKQVHVSEILNLLNADESVKEAVASGAIGKTMAKRIATVAKGDKAAQRKLIDEAKGAGKDQKKKVALKKSVDTTHRAQAAKKGKVLKIRALSDAELSEIGSNMANHLVGLLSEAGFSIDHDIVAMVKKDPKLVIAYSAGALDALKVAAGGANNLVL